ncbi:MAG: urease accessory protein UreD [Gammaproteobacteria bacterium]|nr:urease accessory protein UreD [Gammaproteobacteria bacterium]
MTVSTAVADSQLWRASLELEFQHRRHGTRLSRCEHCGPLYVQKPFYPEGPDWAHVYILHPPGGIVSGDCLDIRVRTFANTGVLLTTPGAARIYRARETLPKQQLRTQLQIEADACLEWFPMETIVYDGADVDLCTDIELTGNARCAVWEISCFGRPASGESFQRGTFKQRYRIQRDGRPLFVDRLSLEGNSRQLLLARAGLQGQPVSGFFLVGPFPKPGEVELLPALQACIETTRQGDSGTVTRVGEFYLGRYLGRSAEQARLLFIAWWQILRPVLMGRPASLPRIWFT